MNAAERAAVSGLGGLRKLASRVEQAFLGVDDAFGESFDVLALSAGDKTSIQGSSWNSSASYNASSSVETEQAELPLPPSQPPQPSVRSKTAAQDEGPRHSINWFVTKDAPSDRPQPAPEQDDRPRHSVSWFVTKDAPPEHPPLTASPSTVLTGPMQLLRRAHIPMPPMTPLPPSKVQGGGDGGGLRTSYFHYYAAAGALGCLVLAMASFFWHLPLVTAPRFHMGIGCFAFGLLAGGRRSASSAAAGLFGGRQGSSDGDDMATPQLDALAAEQQQQHDGVVTNERYAAAVSASRGLSGLSNTERLKLYALFKQTESGDAPSKGPSRLNAVAFAKWQEWDAKRGLAIEGARAQYVEMVERLVQKQR